MYIWVYEEGSVTIEAASVGSCEGLGESEGVCEGIYEGDLEGLSEGVCEGFVEWFCQGIKHCNEWCTKVKKWILSFHDKI